MPDVARILVDNHARFLAFLTPRLGSPEAVGFGSAGLARRLASPAGRTIEDVLQAAFVKGLEKQGTVRDEESAVAWFYRLLRNAVTDHHRRRVAEERAIPRAGAEQEAQVDDEPLRAEVCRCVRDLVPLLKPEYAEVVRRVDLDGVPLQALARELKINHAEQRRRAPAPRAHGAEEAARGVLRHLHRARLPGLHLPRRVTALTRGVACARMSLRLQESWARLMKIKARPGGEFPPPAGS